MSNDGLTARAERGEADAQVLLAEELATRGQGPQAVAWLARAASTQHPYANALLGAWQVYGHLVAPSPAEGLQRLRFAAAQGESAAAALLADLHAAGVAVDASWERAVDWLIVAARCGNARALTQVALLQPGDEHDALRLALLWAAASRGLAVAQALLGRALRSSADAQQVQAGRGWLRLARHAEYPLLTAADFAPGDEELGVQLQAPSPIDRLPWELARRRIELSSLLELRLRAVPCSDDPRIWMCPALVPPVFCEYLVGIAAPLVRRAEVNDAQDGARRLHEMRTNSDITLGPANSDLLLRIVGHRVGLASGLPRANQESPVVLRYRPGEIYDDHHDFIDPRVSAFQADLQARGQRSVTALVYLNQGYEAGETSFPLLSLKLRGKVGDALLWRNVQTDGLPAQRTLHAGLAPTSGEKWVLSTWIRDRAQPLSLTGA